MYPPFKGIIMLEKYVSYVQYLTKKIDEYFDNQREYIACKEKCAICCKNSYYAVSSLEYEYIRIGLSRLSEKKREIIKKKSLEIIKNRIKFLETNNNLLDFRYECPLLFDDLCCNYDYRPLICRAHGLIYYDVEVQNKWNVPYCINMGLNYSNVYDKKLNKILELPEFKVKPQVYDLSYSSMLKEAQDIDFGDIRMLVEWLVIDIPDYSILLKKMKYS